MCFYSGRSEYNNLGAVSVLSLSHLCALLPCCPAESFLMILMDQGRVHKLPVPVQISAWHQRWHKSFFPGHSNAQSMYNSTGHRHCLADQLSHHIFHLLNYASIWVILSLVLLYNTHTSASLRQSSHPWSMNFAIHDFWLISCASHNNAVYHVCCMLNCLCKSDFFQFYSISSCDWFIPSQM